MECVTLTLELVDRAIHAFERAYGITSEQFKNGAPQVREDDAFEWDAYLDHRRVLTKGKSQ